MSYYMCVIELLQKLKNRYCCFQCRFGHGSMTSHRTHVSKKLVTASVLSPYRGPVLGSLTLNQQESHGITK